MEPVQPVQPDLISLFLVNFADEINQFIINPLTLKSYWHLISPYNITPESNIKFVRIREMITNRRTLDC